MKLILKRIRALDKAENFPVNFPSHPAATDRSVMPLSKATDKIFAVMKKAILGRAEERESRGVMGYRPSASRVGFQSLS